MTLGLSDRVQTLNRPAVIVTGSFERTVSDETKLVQSLLESFPDDVVCVGDGRQYVVSRDEKI